jgi:hypothetical protein
MHWDEYESHLRPVVGDSGFAGPLGETPAAARRVFDELLSIRQARIAMLTRLLEANGVALTTTDEGVQACNDWFLANVVADEQRPGRLEPIWYSIVRDIGLFLGEVLVARRPWLHWELHRGGKNELAHHRAVVAGFHTPNPRYVVDFEFRLAGYGHQIVESRGSVGTYAPVTVRGAVIDVQAIVTHRSEPIDGNAFVHWIGAAESVA